MRAVFFGTPEFALPILRALAERHEVAAVVTQPDQPTGRGRRVMPPPVKLRADELGIPVYQFERVRRQIGLDALRGLNADVFVTAAYGQILSQKILGIPKVGTVNVHASLLPKYRGAAPAQWAIINGETLTGVTTMLTDIGIDTGDILLQREVSVMPNDTSDTLLARLSETGASLLLETLDGLSRGTIVPQKQDEEQATHCVMLTKEHGRIDWTKSAPSIERLIRGVKAYTLIGDETLKIHRAEIISPTERAGCAGTVVADESHGIAVACGEGVLRLTEVQAAGGKRMSAGDYLRGHTIPRGTILGENTIERHTQ
ncbi:MAG: methionyl-tRNA formyltransferase [Oscillospiraceae bacterium]|jgi:methionyl-tRNA formyltransferase|nr:methionyl-tRNA formyltransferase [Oscillospiraceae bacterium]